MASPSELEEGQEAEEVEVEETQHAEKHGAVNVGRICSLLVILLICAMIIYICCLMFQSHSLKIQVIRASLTQFDYTNNNSTLKYNLIVYFMVNNPNKKLHAYLDEAECILFYQGSELGSTTKVHAPTRFPYRLHANSVASMSVVLSGQKLMELDVNAFQRDLSRGAFAIDLKINFDVRITLLVPMVTGFSISVPLRMSLTQ